MNILTEPLVFLLHQLYGVTGNLGVSIIALTLIIRGALLPLTLPALKSQRKVRDLQPKLNALKNKHGDDKMALAQAQQALYKEHNVNPLGGCLPYLLQFVVLIALYQVLRQVIGEGANGIMENITFLGLDMTQRDSTYILPILAAGSQLILSLMIMPGADTRNIVPDKSKSSKTKKANAKEEDIADMAVMMQKQMMFVMPVMTGVFAASFPAGLGVYWVTTTVFSAVQQFFVSGPGGLTKYLPWKKKEDFSAESVSAVLEEVKKVEQKAKKTAPAKKTATKAKSKGEDAFAAAFLASSTEKGSPSQEKKTSVKPNKSKKVAKKPAKKRAPSKRKTKKK